MVRTKADSSVKVCAAKAPRKVASSGGSSSASPCRSGSSKDKYAGGNSYNPQPIPTWQKGISAFFKTDSTNPTENEKKEDNEKTEELTQKSPSKESQKICGESSTTLDKNGVISDDED